MAYLKLNSDELKYGKISLFNMLEIYRGKMILCNNIPSVDDWLEWKNDIDDDGDLIEIFQYYIITESYKDLFNRLEYPIAYSNLLDCWVVGITHLGMSWDYILTDISIDDYYTFFKNYTDYENRKYMLDD